jgi:superoxide reductase
MKALVCAACGFIALDGDVSGPCPVCHSKKEIFKEVEDAIVTPSPATDKVELNKKHIPLVKIVKACGLIPDSGCTDVSVKVGETTHPMLKEHFIMYVDTYIDKKYISRVFFSPEKMNPAVGLHLKVSTGTFQAIAKCNLHGAWLTETKI